MPWRRLAALAAALVLAGASPRTPWRSGETAIETVTGAGRGGVDAAGREGRRFQGRPRRRQIGHPQDWYRDRGFRRLHLIAERSDIHLMSVRLVYFERLRRGFPRRQADPRRSGPADRSARRPEVSAAHRDGLPLAPELRRPRHHEGLWRAGPLRRARSGRAASDRSRPGPGRGRAAGAMGGARLQARRAVRPSTATSIASAAARAASRRSGCTCAAPTSTCST